MWSVNVNFYYYTDILLGSIDADNNPDICDCHWIIDMKFNWGSIN